MNNYGSRYGAVNQKPANFMPNSGRILESGYDQQQQTAHQGEYYEDYGLEDGVNIYALVDSWRSYKNDTTNLQQMSTYASYQGHNYALPYQQPLGTMSSSGFEHAAPAFQPAYMPFQTNPVQSHFTPYQPLRISNGQQERMRQQTRFNSSAANNRDGGRYNLRSKVSVDHDSVILDVPIPSIEQRHPWTLPINTNINADGDAFRRITPRRSTRSVTPPLAPSPTRDYLDQATLPSTNLSSSRKLLVVLDLNGTLLRRAVSRGTSFILRPGVTKFIDYLFANHVVMIYSSARPENVTGMVSKLIHPRQRKQLAAIWARDKLDLTAAQYVSKVQVYKRLEKIWANKQIQQRAGQGLKWDQSNTVLVDDTCLKARAQPYNLLRVEEFANDRPQPEQCTSANKVAEYEAKVNAWNTAQQRIVMDLQEKLELLKWTADVSQMIRSWQSKEEEEESQCNKVGDSSQNGGTKLDVAVQPEQTQLLTPKSPECYAEIEFSDSEQSCGGADLNMDVDVDLSLERDDGSVSPIEDSVWKDILDGVQPGDEKEVS